MDKKKSNVYMKIFLTIILFILFIHSSAIFANEQTQYVQTIKGNVVNAKNLQPVVGASISVVGTKLGAYTSKDGNYRILNIPIGRYSIKVTAIGFEPRIYNLLLTSGKESVLNAQLNEDVVRLQELIVTEKKANFKPINESVIVSATEFSIDDVQRFAGSRMDPARMAQNFAGVLGANDTRNDIIIRGGSPIELLWRIDGLDFPNPNHFATQGATGGPVGAINTLLLDNSDFLTGAFPAEYYDKNSGVFDLRFRQGNKDRYEYYGQFGFNGFELGAEGPLPLSTGSFMTSYRYSFLGLLKLMGVNFGFAGIPNYQDFAFKTDITNFGNHQLSLTGIWGTSDIHIKQSETDDVFTGDQDIKNGTDFLGVALNWTYLFSNTLYLKTTTGISLSQFRTYIDSITTDENNKVLSLSPWFDTKSNENYYTIKSVFNYSPSKPHFIKFGAEYRYKFFEFNEKRLTASDDGNYYELNANDNANQLFAFVDWNYKITPNLSTTTGLANNYLQISGKIYFDPRVSIKYNLSNNHSINFGFGVNHQSLPLTIYYQSEFNKQLESMRSIHYVLSYNWLINEDMVFKLETYYKDLSKVPVNYNEANSFSLLNSGANFGRVFAADSLISDGIGRSYGVELTFIKHFTNHYYITSTLSYVRQQYRGSDQIWRWGAFDNQFILNLLAGYELVISPSFAIEFAARYTIAGGSPHTPIDVAKSNKFSETYYLDNQAFSLRNPNYQRMDIRIDFRDNYKSFAIISYISVENILNHQNVLMRIWDKKNQKEKIINQLGIFPIGGLRIEF